MPDERFGEAICAVVEPDGGATTDAGRRCADHVQDARSPPTRRRATWCWSTRIGRAPNGKVDYKRLKALATERVKG